MTDHECPRAFYCLPESCGDCPHDEQPSCVACGRGQAGDKHTCQKYEQAAIVLRKFMCCPAGQEFVAERLIRPFRMDDQYRAEGERAATERIVGMLKEASSDARELWAAKRDSAAASERWASEYWRGQMNGCDHIIVELEADEIREGRA